MNEQTRNEFESWATSLKYDLSKTGARNSENPYAVSTTWCAYEAWCAAREKYGKEDNAP